MVYKLSEEEIERFIKYLDEKTRDDCVNPENMTFDCCDCYICRVDFFNKIRNELKNLKFKEGE